MIRTFGYALYEFEWEQSGKSLEKMWKKVISTLMTITLIWLLE